MVRPCPGEMLLLRPNSPDWFRPLDARNSRDDDAGSWALSDRKMGAEAGVCTENPIRVDEVTESRKLAR
jgi:hypothetical protein